jgi:hypothetical protein
MRVARATRKFEAADESLGPIQRRLRYPVSIDHEWRGTIFRWAAVQEALEAENGRES